MAALMVISSDTVISLGALKDVLVGLEPSEVKRIWNGVLVSKITFVESLKFR